MLLVMQVAPAVPAGNGWEPATKPLPTPEGVPATEGGKRQEGTAECALCGDTAEVRQRQASRQVGGVFPAHCGCNAQPPPPPPPPVFTHQMESGKKVRAPIRPTAGAEIGVCSTR